MANENREIEKMLRKYGFTLKREGKHPIWTNGEIDIVIPKGTITSPRMRIWTRCQIRRRLKEQKQTGDSPTTKENENVET